MANLSQKKRERMLAFLQQLKEEHKDDDSVLIALGEIESELTAKKYGLVWEQHEEAVDIKMRTHIPVFTEVPEREITAVPGGAYNFLLEGDNLHSLRLLERTHKGRIDVIYIDPPYNTGNKDFKYDDTFVDKTDLFAHSKWLSFMSERLVIARELLSENGVIFISIDDDEEAPLKMLCDEIFGYQNFVASAIWEKKFSPQNDAKWLSDSHDFILVYSYDKEKWKPNLLPRTEEMDKRYKNPDNDPRGAWTSGDCSVKTYNASCDYPITTPSGRVVNPPDGYCWRFSKETFAEMVKDNRIWFGDKGNNVPRVKRFLTEVKQGSVCKTIWYRTEVGDTQEGTKDMKAVFNGKAPFTNPKPVRLIERVLKLASNPNSIVLDFFAGSGTTAQAVMELNAADGGNRKFILCTNNENGICENVTYPRIKTVITGKREDGSTYSEGLPANLKYYRTDFVSKDEEYLSDALLEHMTEMIQLEHGVKIDGRQYIIVMDDDEADELAAHWSDYPDAKALYVSKNVLFTTEQNAIFKDVEIHIIPDYYFSFELKEVGESW